MIEKKLVGGTWLPASEEHMEAWMLKEKQERGGRLCYQLHKLDMALEEVPKDRRRVAVDVGAHVGTWSMNLVDEFEHVHAFEPSPRGEIFPFNMRRDNYTLHRTALGDAPRMVAMQEIPHSTGGCYVIPDTTGEVEMRTLDSYGFEVIDFLKVDVEGQELPFCRGARETLLRCRPVVLIEQKGWNDRHVRDGSKHALAYLLELGMQQRRVYSGDYVLTW